LPRTTPNVHDPHDLGGLIDCEEHAINVRAATEIEDANRLIWIENFQALSGTAVDSGPTSESFARDG
jgi:hypothetical protein